MSVRSEFESRLNTWALANNIPVAFEGVPFTKPTNTPYAQSFLVVALVENPNVTAIRTRAKGYFQVNIWGLDGLGALETETLANSLAAAFPVVPKIGTVSVERPPYIAPALVVDAWRCVPVQIYYRVEN
jgi:hypothetical protein